MCRGVRTGRASFHCVGLLHFLSCPAAVFVAAKNKMDLSLGVAIGSSVQVGLLLTVHLSC